MKRLLALVLVLVALTASIPLAQADSPLDKLVGVWMCYETDYIDIISITSDRTAMYMYYKKSTGSVGTVKTFYLSVDPDNENRFFAVLTDSDSKPSVEIFTLTTEGKLTRSSTTSEVYELIK